MERYCRQEEGQSRLRKQLVREAVSLALRDCWEEAVLVNEKILAQFPEDAEAYNRLGKALAELGRNYQSKKAYMKVMEINPGNAIARKNLARLSRLPEEEVPESAKRGKLSSEVFIAERGKVGIARLIDVGQGEELDRLSPGDIVQLEEKGQRLVVMDGRGKYLGKVEQGHEVRLMNLIRGGNKYDAVVLGIRQQEVRLVIREVFSSPEQKGRLSFPARGAVIQREEKGREHFPEADRDTILTPEYFREEEDNLKEEEREKMPEGFFVIDDVDKTEEGEE